MPTDKPEPAVTVIVLLVIDALMLTAVPAPSCTTSPGVQAAIAALIFVASVGLAPTGFTVEPHRLLRVGMPPTTANPAFCQFVETLLAAGRTKPVDGLIVMGVVPETFCGVATHENAASNNIDRPRNLFMGAPNVD
jgi:hypothetical protein